MPESKPSNPKDALGIKKVPLHAVPVKPLLEVGLAMMEGGRKYGTHNYRSIGVRASTYYDAVMRHIVSWWEGEDIDSASGVHHLIKAMACLFVVRDAMHMDMIEDDRPIKYPNGINMEEFNEVAAKLISTYPDCKEPFLQVTKEKQETAIEEIAEEFKDTMTSNAKDDGMWYCSGDWSCLVRGFSNIEPNMFICEKHIEEWRKEHGKETSLL